MLTPASVSCNSGAAHPSQQVTATLCEEEGGRALLAKIFVADSNVDAKGGSVLATCSERPAAFASDLETAGVLLSAGSRVADSYLRVTVTKAGEVKAAALSGRAAVSADTAPNPPNPMPCCIHRGVLMQQAVCERRLVMSASRRA